MTCLDETRHGLEDGDFVTFSEIKGMEALNGCDPRKVTTKGVLLRISYGRAKCFLGPYTFSIGDTTGLGTYKSGGLFTQVKMPKILHFVRQLHRLISPTDRITEIPQRISDPARSVHHRLRQIRPPCYFTCWLSSTVCLL